MKLRIARRTDIALRALLLLESDGGTLRASAMAADLETTSGYLPHVLAPLVRSGWLTSEPGPTGGYRLLDPLVERSLLELIEGPTDDGSCVLRGGTCGDSTCPLHGAWSR